MALTYAHADGRERFDSADILEAMTTVESGTAVNIEYPEEDTRAVALHESGHAAASHVYMKGSESTGSRSACAASRSGTTRRPSRSSASASGAPTRWRR